MTTVALAVIVKDEIDNVKRIIQKYGEYFDAIDLAIDDDKTIAELNKVFDVIKPSKVNIYKYEWKDDFSDKRNFLASKCSTDYYYAIDTDDEIVHPELIREAVDEAKRDGNAVHYGFYLYGMDEDGNCIAAHWKERLIKNSGNLRWNKKIHENLVPVSLIGHTYKLDDRLQVKHLATHEDILASHKRNIKYLVDEYKKDGEKTDPRTIAYLGRILFGVGDFKRSRYFLEKHIELSGWDEDRHQSWCQLSDIFRLQKDYKQAIACAFEALAERPDYPDAYLSLHWIYFDQGLWTKAIDWGEQGLKKEPPRNFMFSDPSGYTWRPALSLSYCYFNIGDFEKALNLFNFAKKLAPSVEFVKQNDQLYVEGVERKHFIDHLLWMVAYCDANKGDTKKLIESIPATFFENQTISVLRNKYLDPKVWNDKSVAIYCGDTPSVWSPESVESGIGGSEEAVIHMGKELTKLGYEVTVYCTCGKEGVYDGVQYLTNVRFNPKDKFNIVIGWRCNIFAYQVQGKRKIVWCHDLPAGLRLTAENCRFFDKLVVLSQYHKSLLPECVPDEKIYVSTNGINPEDFVGLENIKREPHRIIYASSYDRGVEMILENWQHIRESVPDAQIHCYYGLNTYQDYLKTGLIQDDGFLDRMTKLFAQDGVFDHGRVGHKELAREYAKASIFAYPSKYAGEINCIALTKAIACGCYPLTNDFAVLGERNKHGKVVKNDKFIPALISLLRHGDTQIDNKGYIEANSWGKVAEDWDNNLFPCEIEVVLDTRHKWSMAQLGKKAKIVDIGSNKGHMFEEWDRTNITSVDIDEYDLPNFVRASADDLPFKDKEFDYACLFEIVEHTKNPIKVLSEACRVAKTTIITVPFEYEWADELEPFATLTEKKRLPNFEHNIKEANPAKKLYDDGYAHLFHEVFYTPELLQDHLVKAGFKEIKITKIRFGKWAWLGAVCV